MKIDKIIFAVDDNPRYQGLWEINSEICKKVLGITPVLFHITDEESDFYEDEYGIVKKIKKLNKYPSSFQAQIYRMYGTKYFQEEICVLSDIDLLTVNKSYFTDTIKDFETNNFVVFSDDAYDPTRPECVGIYTYPRIYMSYNAAKGKVFDEILNTDRSFDCFCEEVFETYPEHHDCDEIFLGKKINYFEDQGRIKRLRRGFTSPFICPNRLDRPAGEHTFNYYDENQILSDNLIDINLSRPYSKYKVEINKLKNLILNKNKEVFLIGCHVENSVQEVYLRELVDKLKKHNKDYIITSHTLVPKDIIEGSVAFIYDSINPKYKTWELNGYHNFKFETDDFEILSPYLSYGASEYYHVGVIRLISNAINYIKNTNYKIVHWIEYDTIFNSERFETSSRYLMDHDFVFYGVGNQFSFRLDSINDNFISMTDSQILNKLEENDFVAEKLIWNNLSKGKIKTLFQDEQETNTWSRYSQSFHATKVNWSLLEIDGRIHLFLHNINENIVSVVLEIHNQKTFIELFPYNWNLRDLSFDGPISNFVINVEDKVLVDTDLSIAENYYNIVGKVKFIRKK